MNEQSLTQQLQARKDWFKENFPIELQENFAKEIEKLRNEVSGKKAGEKASNFKLPNTHGQEVVFYDELAKGPVVLVFYRGGWCPFCNMQMNALQRILPDIHAMGAQLIAISLMTPDNSLTLQEKNDLQFQVLSDQDGNVTTEYNLLFSVPQVLKEVIESTGVDLVEHNNTSEWILPVPATFVVDKNAVIQSAYVNSDWMQRQSTEKILRELDKLKSN